MRLCPLCILRHCWSQPERPSLALFYLSFLFSFFFFLFLFLRLCVALLCVALLCVASLLHDETVLLLPSPRQSKQLATKSPKKMPKMFRSVQSWYERIEIGMRHSSLRILVGLQNRQSINQVKNNDRNSSERGRKILLRGKKYSKRSQTEEKSGQRSERKHRGRKTSFHVK